MKTKNIAFAVIAAALIIAIGCIAMGYAADTTPGSSTDPVVTKAYVDKAIAELKTEFQTNGVTTSDGAVSAQWEVVFAEAGKSIIGGQGTQMILRSGKAVITLQGPDGVSDLTAAGDLKDGTKVELNHLLLFPRADGRGIKLTADAYVMVLGSYEVKSAE